MRDEHAKLSPECDGKGPLDLPVPPLPPDHRMAYVESYLKPQVWLAEEKAASRVLDRTFLAVIKNDLVWLDCQLGTDGKSVEMYKELETLNERLSKLRAS